MDSASHKQFNRQKHSGSSSKEVVTNTGAVQNADHWSRLRETVSGMRATVGNVTFTWKNRQTDSTQNEDTTLLQTKATTTASEINERERMEKVETSQDNAKLEVKIKEETSPVTSQHVYIQGDEEKEQYASWVQQILDIQDKHDRQMFDNRAKASEENLTSPEFEKLDDPLSETNTEPPTVWNKSYVLVSDIYNKVTFSSFSKAVTGENSHEQLSEGVTTEIHIKQSSPDSNQSSMPSEGGQSTTSEVSTSTMSRIRDAVTFSARKNRSSSALTAAQEEKPQGASTDIRDDSVAKRSKLAETDRSYWNMLSNLQQNILLGLSLTSASPATKTPAEMEEQIARNIMHSELESESAFSQRTSSLSSNLVRAESTMSKLKRLDELCLHLVHHPQFRHIAVKHKVLPRLLDMCVSGHPKIISRANEALALIGYHRPPRGRGIRMLSIDGGGTRGLIAIETLLRLERLCGQPVHQMFDFVIGSSTGALLASLIFLMKTPLDQCKELYLDRSAKMFVKESLLSKTRNMALHDVSIFEEVIRKEIGEESLTSSSRDPTTPRMAITSTLSNVPKWKTFLFRNYNHRPGVISDYRGSCNLKIWQAVRASGSAPIYYSPFQIGEHIFRDGGCLANNPTAVGLHECKLLWPGESFQCILSLGNGKYDPALNKLAKSGYNVIPRSMKDLADGIIDSATDTEEVHMILKNTLDPACYFRFSPYLQENYPLSEVNPVKVKAMLAEADAYMDKNEMFMQKLVTRINLQRLPNQKLMDFTDRLKQTHDYIIF